MENSKKAPPVTVVIRSKNVAWVIREALEGLFSQSYQDFELLVVDSGSEDETLEILREFPHRLIEIKPEAYFPGKVLNMAIENCASEIIVLQNSDVIPQTPDSLTNLLKALDDPGVAATYARQVPRPEAHPWVRRDYTESFPESGSTPEWLGISFPFAALKRSLWKQHPFCTDAYSSEDEEWALWAEGEGHEVRYVPDAVVMHSHNYTLSELYGRRFVEGEATAFFNEATTSSVRFVLRALAAMARDARYYVSQGEFIGVPGIPLRRAVEFWAYAKGFRYGKKRRNSSEISADLGQDIALKHHSERRPKDADTAE